jgi:tRNA(Ile)-lysidine synthase
MDDGKTYRGGRKLILGVSGGPDSVYLANELRKKGVSLVFAHVNHGARGEDSEKDQEFVELLGRDFGAIVEVRREKTDTASGSFPSGFEDHARKVRASFLGEIKERHGADTVLLAHTADDQIETVLMRFFEGAGLSGLKGIPRKTKDGTERPLLDTWRSEIVDLLDREGRKYRIDRSNNDTRFERNWIRHVLLPLLEKRYGPSVRKRLHVMGERFREIDAFLEAAARRWIGRHVKCDGGRSPAFRFPRTPYGKLPSLVRKKILQLICHEKAGIRPNERLLESMDELTVSGKGSSAVLSVGNGLELKCRYKEAVLAGRKDEAGAGFIRSMGDCFRMEGPGRYATRNLPDVRVPEGPPAREGILWEEKGTATIPSIRKASKGERKAFFDADEVPVPLLVRPLRGGDRCRPFGRAGEKKVKEILIERKIPREERWGRPVVCDREGRILWIPGVARSSFFAVTKSTRRMIVLTNRIFTRRGRISAEDV